MKFDKEIKERIGSKGLIMSRVPQKSKIAFIKLAKEEFEGDYGMTLKFLLDSYSLEESLSNFEFKINYLIELVEKGHTHEEKPEKIKLLSGKKIKIGGKE